MNPQLLVRTFTISISLISLLTLHAACFVKPQSLPETPFQGAIFFRVTLCNILFVISAHFFFLWQGTLLLYCILVCDTNNQAGRLR